MISKDSRVALDRFATSIVDEASEFVRSWSKGAGTSKVHDGFLLDRTDVVRFKLQPQLSKVVANVHAVGFERRYVVQHQSSSDGSQNLSACRKLGLGKSRVVWQKWIGNKTLKPFVMSFNSRSEIMCCSCCSSRSTVPKAWCNWTEGQPHGPHDESGIHLNFFHCKCGPNIIIENFCAATKPTNRILSRRSTLLLRWMILCQVLDFHSSQRFDGDMRNCSFVALKRPRSARRPNRGGDR